MKKTALTVILLSMLSPLFIHADGYTQLWKKVEEAGKNDLPRTQIEHLQTIISKAESEKNYGQLLKAEWQTMWTWALISPDSLAPQIERLERKAGSYAATDPALSAVCYAALGKTAAENFIKGRRSDTLATYYFGKALASPALLAEKQADAYEPFVVKGRDAGIFNNDLLSLIGYTARAYKTMHDYYATTPNRTATLLTALDMVRHNATADGLMYARTLKGSGYVASLDSLTALYQDIDACAEVAIAKYEYMDRCTDVTPEEKVNYINENIIRWGKWPRTKTLGNALKTLTNPELTAGMSHRMSTPANTNSIIINVRNISKLTVSVTRLSTDGTTDLDPSYDKAYKRLATMIVKGSEKTITRSYTGHKDYETVTDTVSVGRLPAGVYLVEITPANSNVKPARNLIYVTDMFIVSQQLPGNKTRIAVLSSTTGQPVAGATVYIGKEEKNRLSYKCDSNGEITVDNRQNDIEYIRACTETDNAMPFVYSRNIFGYYDADNDGEAVSLFTDRKIYRPGQTVHVAAIARSIKGTEQKALSGRTIKLTLRDANYKTVAEKDVTTDAYGTASADFALPSGGLTGTFTVRTETSLGGSAGFSVEEYKRPTFNISFDEVDRKYTNGDTVTVCGHAKTYSGVAVQGAKVIFTVTRRQALWWRMNYIGTPFNDAGNTVLAHGETVTGADGTFRIDMPMSLPAWDNSTGISEEEYRRIGRFYNITAEVDVTDIAGESHRGDITLPLGNKAVSFGCDIPEQTLRDSMRTITFTLRNSAGNDIDGDVKYTVSGISGTFTAKANMATEITWNGASQLRSGRHTLTAICGSDTIRRVFTVFSYDDTTPCVKTSDWFYVSSDEFPRDGSPVYMQFGSSDADVHVLYTVISGEKVLKNGTLGLSNEIKTYRLPYREEYGTGIRINLIWVKNGKAYAHNTGIKRPLPDKRLNVKWTTFRDRLTPGQKEEWSLSITRPDGMAADAQLLATMYDASLDQLAQLSWQFPPYMSQSLPYSNWTYSKLEEMFMHTSARLSLPEVKPLDFSRFTTNRWEYLITGQVLSAKEEVAYAMTESKALTGAVNNMKVRGAAPVIHKDAVMESLTLTDEKGTATNLAQSSDSDGGGEEGHNVYGSDAANMQIRENMDETAFFYPALLTDTAGNVSVKFTLPESVTTWHFMGFAHDKSMNYGQIEGRSVASKKVMIQPNMPRFMRTGDRAHITARIFNTSGIDVKGTAVMQLTDPETDDIIYETTQKFNVSADSTGSVSFSYKPDSDHTLLVCRIFAEGKDFSDGEQHYLPILPDCEPVTTTVPFTQHGQGVKTIDLKPLFAEGGRNRKLTIEYMNNPSWMVIQALPYINDAREDNAISLATAYYANSIGAYIIKQSPKIKIVFDQWKHEAGQESLISSLGKNQELKNIILDETPWLADADRESDQKQMLANYFDESNLNNNIATSLEKLRKLQNTDDGSWCWWQGMRYGSPSLTASIVETLVRLNNITGNRTATKGMVDKAMNFLGETAIKEYERAKDNEKKGRNIYINLDYAVHYLYICALSDYKLSAEESKAADYMLEYVKKQNAGMDLYYKALTAVVLAERGETELAKEYLKSLEEYSVASEELGRYYDSPRAGYNWFDYRIPTQVAVIEAMSVIDAKNYAGTIDEMKLWLLQLKRVQGWDTPINSVNAVYTFLNGNTEALGNKAASVLAVDGKQLSLPTATAGLGYVKTTIDPRKASTFTATKTSEGTSWGAIYAQSTQKTSSITASSAGFSVTRTLLTPDGKPATTLKTGDKVTVRISITADRDYDYVDVKDKRAACMEPVIQLSGYRMGYYCTPKDNVTNYYFDRMSKGTHVIETEYYIDRAGSYETGTCTVQCAYAPEYAARTAPMTLEIK